MAIETMLYCGSFDLVACELTFVSLLMFVDFVPWPICAFDFCYFEMLDLKSCLDCEVALLALLLNCLWADYLMN